MQRSSRSIGEVLALLKKEFANLTISKIRFLEGQGLINPRRTPSGYRQFSDEDVDRLRFILQQQQDHFLPLKVIKTRLREHDEKREAERLDDEPVTPPPVQSEARSFQGTGAMLTRSDLLGMTNLTERQLRELESFGLIKGRATAEGQVYPDDAVMVGRYAGRLLEYGVEPRHLRIFKTGAEREADLYRQLAGPMLARRGSHAHSDAMARLEELQEIGEAIRAELLRQALEG